MCRQPRALPDSACLYAQVISLGIHVIEVGPEAYRMLLMEVGPSVARSLVRCQLLHD